MKAFTLCLSVLVTGCGATLIPHTVSKLDAEESQRIVERHFMEQVPAYRPERVIFEKDFIEIRSGYVSKGRSGGVAVPVGNVPIFVGAGSNRGTSKELVTRIYYDSIDSIKLYKWRSHYVVMVRNKDDIAPVRVYSNSLPRSEKFVDALESLWMR